MLYYTMCFFASEEVRSVLILVVLDDALVPNGGENMRLRNSSLNPCCAGRCSSTVLKMARLSSTRLVSILVVLDDALVLEKQRLY